MSEEFRRSILNRLPANAMPPPMAPTKAPWAEAGMDADEEEELADEIGQLGAILSKRTATVTPLSAADFFAQALEVVPPGRGATFRAYYTPCTPPSGPSKCPNGTVVIAHHGAGASGLSFAALAKDVREKSGGELGLLAYDARGHGKTTTDDPAKSTDFSLATILADLVAIVEHVFPDPKTAPSLLLIGHSMGASPVLSAVPLLQDKGYSVPGVAALDIVEGTAVEALPNMKHILSQLPTSFLSVSDAIQWHLTSGSIRNTTSARVSVPSYIKPAPGGDGPDAKQVWRTDLLSTEPFWAEWYAGLSNRFLSARCARLLVLAGQERLDRELMVGQMQGKLQLEVMQYVGHYLHEDDPEGMAAMLVAFWRRNTQVLVLPPKIGAKGPAVEVKHVGDK